MRQLGSFGFSDSGHADSSSEFCGKALSEQILKIILKVGTDMKTRIITALVCIPLLAAILLSPGYVICLAAVVVSVIGLYEFYGAVGLSDKKPLTAVGYISGVCIPICMYLKPWLIEHLPTFCENASIYILILALFAVLLIFHKKIDIENVSLLLFGSIYIPYFLSHITAVRELPHGKFLIWLIFIGAFLTDTGAYFVGVFFGKHKLCPEISPKKTIEGAFGGILGGTGFYLIYGLILKHFFGLSVDFAELAVMGALVSVISQFGDLTASVIKRRYGIKDYGTLFPGHGGILDRCDSVILVAPAVYLMLTGIFTVIH